MGYIEKTLNIGGQEVTFRASAASPRFYRNIFGRDIIKDMTQLTNSVGPDGSVEVENLELFENLAYCFARQAAKAHGTEIPSDPDDWLDQFEMFSIYEILPELLELWGRNMATMVPPKKK